MTARLWPSDPKSTMVATGIDWTAASPLAFQAPISVWKRLTVNDALRLANDTRYKPIFKALPADVQSVVMSIAIKEDKLKEKLAEDATRDSILKEVDEAIKEAGDSDNIGAKLQGIKLKAELFQLLTKKPQEDTQITINVVTGVERE